MFGPISLKNKMLSNPLHPKTSTPIRARIMPREISINSTPINQLEQCLTPNPDKENFDCSNISSKDLKTVQSLTKVIEKQSTAKGLNIMSFADFRLNKKNPNGNCSALQVHNQAQEISTLSITQRSKLFQHSVSFSKNNFRSLTPNSTTKTQNQTANFSNEKRFKIINTKCNPSITLSKETLNKSLSSSSLRNSNSFSSIFQPRSKSPNLLGSMAFRSLSCKNNPLPGNKKENSFFKNSQGYQGERGEGSQLMNSQIGKQSFNNSFVEAYHLNCMNHNAKAAKYRLKISENETNDKQNCFYCSKCAIELVQKGFCVEELKYPHPINSYTSLQDMHQSKTLNPSLVSSKTSPNFELLKFLKNAEDMKHQISEKIASITKKREITQRKINQQIDSIDCYYDSLVSYIEQQRARDRQVVEAMAKKILSTENGNEMTIANSGSTSMGEQTLQKFHEALEQALRNQTLNPTALNLIHEAKKYLQLGNDQPHYSNKHLQAMLNDEQRPLLIYQSSIQQQFDEFVSHFDTYGKLHYKTFEETGKISRNNALRFSFEKALQTKNGKKPFIYDSNLMSSLQQESEEDYDENSFGQEHMKQAAEGGEKLEQKPFRTLFAEEDDILEGDEEDTAKNDMFSPTFKSI